MKNIISPTTIVASKGGGVDSKFTQLINGTLTEVTEEDLQGVTKVNDYAFYNQQYLRSFDFTNINTIGNSAFINTPSLRQNVFLKDTTVIKGTPFQNSGITKFKGFGFDTTTVPTGMFKSCGQLTHIEFNEGVTVVQSLSGGQGLRYNAKVIIPSTCITLNSGNYSSSSCTICKATTPPTLGYAYGSSVAADICFVPLASIDEYKTYTNWVSGANKIFPFVKTESDLSAIDTTLYTKACVKGNDKGIEDDNNYKVYNYTNGEWIAE